MTKILKMEYVYPAEPRVGSVVRVSGGFTYARDHDGWRRCSYPVSDKPLANFPAFSWEELFSNNPSGFELLKEARSIAPFVQRLRDSLKR